MYLISPADRHACECSKKNKNKNEERRRFIETDTRISAFEHDKIDNESLGVGLSLNGSQHIAALPGTTPCQVRRSSADDSELRRRTEAECGGRRCLCAFVSEKTVRRSPFRGASTADRSVDRPPDRTFKVTSYRAFRLAELTKGITARFV